ncbi:hypothetical protein ILUMI_16892, partial [Ignelater luminosus]
IKKEEKNIVISGLDMNNMDLNSLKETMEKFILEHMNIQIEPKKGYKLSDKMCLIELKNLEDKATIMKNKAKEKQKQIRRKANEKKGNGKDVKIGYNKIIIDGVEWRWDRTKGKLEKAQLKKLKEYTRVEKKKTDKAMCKVMRKAKIDTVTISEKERTSKNSYLKIGTWNVQGSYEPGAIKNLVREIKNISLIWWPFKSLDREESR